MFTGLIREFGEVKSLQNELLTIKISQNTNKTIGIGDSIAINGVCLTVIKKTTDTFSVELSNETSHIIAIENYKSKVHIEQAMLVTDRLDGHIVQGHVDVVGKISKINKSKNGSDFHINCDKRYLKFIIPKGSITIDGVSLTVNDVYSDGFRLTIINHTLDNTLFQNYKLNQRVNIETDMFARYLFHMFSKNKNMSWDEVNSVLNSNW
jgi:riboflavin synthase